MQQWMIAGVDAADEFVAAVDRKVTNAEATAPAQPAGTVNLTGSLRLYDDIATAPDGEGDTFCYGKGAYRDFVRRRCAHGLRRHGHEGRAR